MGQTTWYSYQSGNFLAANRWNTQPDGSGSFNTAGVTPAADDNLVIQSGHIMTLTANGQINQTTAGRTLVINGTLDAVAFTCAFQNVSGTGTLRLNTITLPTGTYTSFGSASGGTVEYYNLASATHTLSTTVTTYRNLILSNSGATTPTFVLASNLTLNGSLSLSNTGPGTITWQINNATNATRTITIAEDLTVSSGCNVTVSTGQGLEGAAERHQLSVGGSFTNNGTVRLFEQTGDASSAGGAQDLGLANWTSGAVYTYAGNYNDAADLTFTGTANESFTCNGTTDLYRLIVNKGTDPTPELTITASAAANLRLFGPNNLGATFAGGDAADPNPINNKAFAPRNGTIRLKGSVTIPSLAEAGGGDWTLGANCALILDDPTVEVYMTLTGLNGTGGQAISLQGLVQINNGLLDLGNSGGFFLRATGRFVIHGGFMRAMVFRPSGTDNDNLGGYTQTGGTVHIDGYGEASNPWPRFTLHRPNMSFSMSGGTLHIATPTAAGGGINGAIAIACRSENVNVTGGTVVVTVPASTIHAGIASTAPFYNLSIIRAPGAANTGECRVMSLSANGVAVAAQPLVVLNDLTIFDAPTAGATTVFNPLTNSVTVGRHFTVGQTTTSVTAIGVGAGGAGYIRDNTSSPVAANIAAAVVRLTGGAGSGAMAYATLGSADGPTAITGFTLISGGLGYTSAPSVSLITATGTGFTAGTVTTATNAGGASYTPSAGQTTSFNGTVAQTITADVAVTYRGLTTSGTGGISFVGSAPTVSEVLTIGSGSSLADGGLIVSVTGNVANSGTHTGTGQIRLTGAAATQTISGSGGIFTNLSLDNTASVLKTGTHTVNGTLRLTAFTVWDIGSSSLTLGPSAVVYDALTGTGTAFSGNQMIQTAGAFSDAGVSIAYSGTGARLFPIGSGFTINASVTAGGAQVNPTTPFTTAGVSSGASVYCPDFTLVARTVTTVGANFNINPSFGGNNGGTTVTIRKYTPITLNPTATTYGTITVRPVNGAHPNATTPAQALSCYWRVTSSGFAGVTNLTLTNATHLDQDLADALTVRAVRFNRSTLSWADVGTTYSSSGTTTLQNLNAQTSIDGEYTAGTTTGIPAGAVATYYSKANGAWDAAATWSTASHSGVDNSGPPAAGSVVIIGDGATFNHTISAPTSMAFRITVGTVTINPGSTLDLASHTSSGGARDHSLGVTTLGSGQTSMGTYRQSNANVPSADWSAFTSATGGLFEYYTTADLTLPVRDITSGSDNLLTYRNLRLTPAAAGIDLALPLGDLTVRETLTVNGSTITSLVVTNDDAARTITIGSNLTILGGSFQFINGTVQTITVGGNVSIATGSSLITQNAGTVVANSLTIGGSLSNGGTLTLLNGTRTVALSFTGSSDVTFSGAGTTTLSTMTVNKGTSQAPLLDITTSGTFTAATSGWLTLQNGTCRFSNSNTLTLTLISTATQFSIPATAMLSANSSGLTLNVTNFSGVNEDTADVLLAGKLQVIAGTVNINPNIATANGDIEYSAYGFPEIELAGGNLAVGGQIRRPLGTTDGSLRLINTNGQLSIQGNDHRSNRAKLEVLNAGSQFVHTGGQIALLLNGGGGTVFGDLYLNPSTSSVSSGGLITFSTTSGTLQTYRLAAAVPIGSLRLTNAGAGVTVEQYHFPLEILTSLEVQSSGATYNCRGLDLTFGSSLQLTFAGSLLITGQNTLTHSGAFSGAFSNAGTVQVDGARPGGIYNFVKRGSFPYTLSSPLVTYNDLTVVQGTLATGANTLSVVGNVTNSGSITSTSGSLTLTDVPHTIDGNGTGTIQNLVLIGSFSPIVTTLLATTTINGTLTLGSAGANNSILATNNRNLRFGTAASVVNAGPAFGPNNKIRMSGALGDQGITKSFTGTSTFSLPVGLDTRYQPVEFNNYTVSGTVPITLVPVNGVHPNAGGPGADVLSMYWKVVAGGNVTSLTGTSFFYDDADITGSETNFVTARQNAGTWTTADGTVTTPTNQLAFTNSGDITGDYTAGVATRFVNPTVFETAPVCATGCDWEVGTSWVGGSVPTANSRVRINTGHTANRTSDGILVSATELNGTLNVGATILHNLGTITGLGTLRVESTLSPAILPAASYLQFVGTAPSASVGTITFAGASSYTLPPFNTTYGTLTIDGTGTKTLPANTTLTLNRNLNVNSGATLNLNANTLFIASHFTLATGGALQAAGSTVTLYNTSSILTGDFSGTNSFETLRLQNTGGLPSATLGTATTNLSATTLDILSGSFIMAPTNTVTLGTLNGPGMLEVRRTSPGAFTFPTVTINNLTDVNSPSRGTVSYYAQGAGAYTLPASPSVYHNLNFENGGAFVAKTLSLTAPITVNGILTKVAATDPLVVTTTTANVLTLSETALLTFNGTATSYFEGPVIRRQGTTSPFSIPLGSNGRLRPLVIAPSNLALTSFRGQFQQADPSGLGFSHEAVTAPITNVSRQEVYTCDRLSGSANATLTLAYGAETNADPGPITSLRVARWTGSSWESVGGTASGTVTSGTVQSSTVTSFSPFIIASINPVANPLPVTWLQVAAEWQGSGARVNWSTASELNNDYFDIERRLEGSATFAPLGRVLGSGTTQQVSNYSFFDADVPQAGRVFYRIRQVDLDGTFSFSPVVELRRGLTLGESRWAVYPNPVVGELAIVALDNAIDSQTEVSAQLISIAGHRLFAGRMPLSQIQRRVQEALAGAASGLYVFEIAAPDAAPTRIKLIKP